MPFDKCGARSGSPQQEVSCTQWYALHYNMATLFNNRPYISSSGLLVSVCFDKYLSICYAVSPTHSRFMHTSSTHMHCGRRMASNTLPPQSLQKIAGVFAKSHITLKTKLKRTIPREFPGYWWLFWCLSHYSARLVEERKKITILSFDCFRLATLDTTILLL